MAINVGELLATLGIDTSKFRKGRGDAQGQMKGMRTSGDQLQKNIDKWRKGLDKAGIAV